jgi:two-component system response regulator AtoC
MPTRILIVDDEPDTCLFLRTALEKLGYAVEEAAGGEEAITGLEGNSFDLIIMDIKLPGMSGIDATRKIMERDPEALVIIMTSFDSQEAAQASINAGAHDYFTKPVKLKELEIVIKRALQKASLKKELKKDRELQMLDFPGIVGASEKMREVLETVKKIQNSNLTVLIEGESGTGKELIARAIHGDVTARQKPFVAFNSAAIPETLLESELFGIEKGTATGVEAKKGKFEQAHGGTIFLDEIADMSLTTQAKALRVLEERKVVRVGGTKVIPVEVRLIAATNKNLFELVGNGLFREDLYYRLNTVVLRLPALRERREDIPLLTDYFFTKFKKTHNKDLRGFDKRVMEKLVGYHWPGNVRELKNCIERAALLEENDIISVGSLPAHFREEKESSPQIQRDGGSLEEVMQGIERDLITRALKECRGVQSTAAQRLGISERSMWYKVKKFGIDTKTLK